MEKVWICYEAVGFMDSKKGRVVAVFDDEKYARRYAAKHTCYVEEWEIQTS